MQAGELALDVEEADLAEVEELAVEVEPGVHVAAMDVVGQVVEIVETHAPGLGGGNPVELGVVGVCAAILVGEIDQGAADPENGGQVEGLFRPFEGRGAVLHGMGEGVTRVGHPPAHRGGAGTVFLDELAGVAAGLVVQDVGDVALLPKLDRFGLVPRGQGIAHPSEDRAQFFGVRMGEFDELEPVGPGGVLGRDHRAGSVVRKGAHWFVLRLKSFP